MTSSSRTATGEIGLGLIACLAILTALDAMAIDMYLPAFPAVAQDFGVSASAVQQTLTVFLVGLAVGQGLYGPLLDRYGRRLPLLIGTFIFSVGALAAAVAPTLEWMLAARFLQALGAAAGLVAPRAIVTDVCSVRDSARIFAVLMQVMMIAPILAPLAGGLLLAHGEWRMIFWALTAISLLCLVWAARIVPETLAIERRVALDTASILRSYLRQCRSTPFMAYTLAGGFVLGSLFIYISASPFVLIQHFGLSPSAFSYFFAANAVGLIAAGQLSICLLKRWPAARILNLGLIAHALAGLALLLAVRTGLAGQWVYLPLLGLSIWALGLTFGNLPALTMAQAGPQAGIASALMGLLQYLVGAAVGLAAGLLPAGPGALPLTLLVCGILACLLCRFARRCGDRQVSSPYASQT